MNSQKGAALIVVLSLLTISLMVGLSSMQSSQIDERLAGNYKAASQAQMAAEEAASAGWAYLTGLSVNDLLGLQLFEGSSREELEDVGWDAFMMIDDKVSGDVCSGDKDCRYLLWEDEVSGQKYIIAKGTVAPGGEPVALSETVFAQIEFGPKSSFKRGLLSSDKIRVTGNSTIVGDVHSNGTVDISITNSQFEENDEGEEAQVWSLSDGDDFKVEVPLPGPRPSDDNMSSCDGSDDPSYCYETFEDNAISEYASRDGAILSCSVNIDDLDDEDVVYCDGDLVVGGGSVENREVTLVSTGNVTMNGATSSSPPDEAEIGLYVISGGNIEFNGSTDNYGVFWAAGSVRQNGNSSLFGSIVSGNVIRSNGGIDFTSIDNITNVNTFVELSLVDWK